MRKNNRTKKSAARRRDAILEAVAFAAQRFLEVPDWQVAIGDVLGRLGEASSASRTSVFQNHRTDDGEVLSTMRFEWTAPGTAPVIHDPGNQAFPYRAGGLGRWQSILEAGEPVVGRVRDLPENERAMLTAQRVLSVAVVPIRVGSDWWGVIGFNDCATDRVWTHTEIDALRTAAGILGAVIQQERAEAQREEAEDRYRTLVEHIPAVMYVQSPEGDRDPFYISPQVETILGYTPLEWQETQDFWEMHLHPDDRERALAEDERTNRTGDPVRMEYRFLAGDGIYRWVRDEAVLVREESGLVFWRGFLVDVTEHKHAERELTKAERRYRSLVEHIPAVMYVQSINHEEDRHETFYISPQVEAILGYTPEQWIESPTFWEQHVHPDDLDAVLAEDERTNRTGDPFRMEYRFLAGDGSYRWILDEGVLIQEDEGGPVFWRGFLLDITERRSGEEALERALDVEREAAQRLRALDEMKNTFLQAVSHDLRTPLSAILGLAVTLARPDMDLGPEESRELADRIAVNARKLERLVTDLLDLDRLSRGMVEPVLQPTDIAALLARAVDESELLGRTVHVIAPPITVHVDAAKVERIVENLLANTARHTPSGASVWVRAEPATGGIVIAVEDDGDGVAEEERDRIFQPFRQGSDAPRHSPGVGVGLALVARFAELHGGRAWVEERAGGGASFRVFLPDSTDGGAVPAPPPLLGRLPASG